MPMDHAGNHRRAVVRMGARDPILTRLAVLAVAAFLALCAVGGLALYSLDRVEQSNMLLANAQNVLSQEQAVDMTHDELRSDVLAVLTTTGADRVRARREVTLVAGELRTGLRGRDGQLAALSQVDISREFAATQAVLVSYAASGEQVAAVAGDPVASRRALTAFEGQFVQARDRMAGLTTRLRGVAEDARARSAGAERQGRKRTAEVGAAIMIILLGLTNRVWRSVRISLRATYEVECALTSANAELSHDAARQALRASLQGAFAVAANEGESQEVVRRAVRELAPGHRAELLLADNSRAHLTRAMTEQVGEAPGCGVLTPADCMAVRSGRTEVFASVDGISVCPKLAGRSTEVGWAICAPVTFLGEGLGVLHVASEPGAEFTPDAAVDLGLTADYAGNRIGALRTFARSQLQAKTDSLTGLLNRRAAEQRSANCSGPGAPQRSPYATSTTSSP